MNLLKNTIEKAWEDRALLSEENTINAIREVIDLLDAGKLRVAEPVGSGWQVNEWAFNEGCLSIPDVREDVFRQEKVTFEYQDEDFNTHTETLRKKELELCLMLLLVMELIFLLGPF